MSNRYKILLLICAALVLLLPFSMLVFSLFSQGTDGLPDYRDAHYFAITAADGEEYVFRPSEPIFLNACAVFLAATPTKDGIADSRTGGHMMLEWIKDGVADRYTLSFSYDMRTACLLDANGNLFRLADGDTFPFLQSAAGAASLIDEYPSPLTLDGKDVAPSVLEWRATLTDRDGEEHTFTSGDRLLYSSAPVRIASPQSYSLAFAEMPTSVSYTVFCGEELVCSGEGIPSSFNLPAGSYQLVLVAEWKDGNTAVRAGYSIIFSVA